MTNEVKILFEVECIDSDEIEIESMWAIPQKEGYKIDNIPFYAKNVALNDIVTAEEIEGDLYAGEVLFPSGHSTVRIYFFDTESIRDVIDTLKTQGCDAEISDNPNLVAIDIPAKINYSEIREYLNEGEAAGRWEYEEGCLGFL